MKTAFRLFCQMELKACARRCKVHYAETETYTFPVCLDLKWMQVADTTFRASWLFDRLIVT